MTKEEVIELYNHLYKKENKEEMFAIDNFPNMTEKKCDAVKQIGIDDVKKLCSYHPVSYTHLDVYKRQGLLKKDIPV